MNKPEIILFKQQLQRINQRLKMGDFGKKYTIFTNNSKIKNIFGGYRIL